MKFKVEMKGLDRVKSRVKAVPTAIEAELRDVIFKVATEVKDEAIAAIHKPKTGKIYRRGNFFWRASAPGEAPAKKTGKNVDLIKSKKANRKGRPTAKIIAPRIYRMLEKGMALGKPRQVLPRPLFGPIMQKYRNEFRDRVEAAAKKVFRIHIRRK